MKKLYTFQNAKVTLSNHRGYAHINNGNLIPIKYDKKSPFVINTVLKDNGCIKRVERLRLV